MDDNADRSPAIDALLRYLAARNAWERAAAMRLKAAETPETDFAAHIQIRAEYAALLAQFCAPRINALDLKYSFQDPPSVDPAQTKIISVRGDPNRTRIRTEESAGGVDPEIYDYELVDVDGRWMIEGRRFRAYTGRWIRDVF